MAYPECAAAARVGPVRTSTIVIATHEPLDRRGKLNDS
jgi:hypothetical protein